MYIAHFPSQTRLETISCSYIHLYPLVREYEQINTAVLFVSVSYDVAILGGLIAQWEMWGPTERQFYS